MELLNLLMCELGVSFNEARDGTAFLLHKAKKTLRKDDFEKILIVFPEFKAIIECETEEEIKGMMGDFYMQLLLSHIEQQKDCKVCDVLKKALV